MGSLHHLTLVDGWRAASLLGILMPNDSQTEVVARICKVIAACLGCGHLLWSMASFGHELELLPEHEITWRPALERGFQHVLCAISWHLNSAWRMIF